MSASWVGSAGAERQMAGATVAYLLGLGIGFGFGFGFRVRVRVRVRVRDLPNSGMAARSCSTEFM